MYVFHSTDRITNKVHIGPIKTDGYTNLYIINMANVTDPFARAIHGTDPQNLIEYITRQRIYESLFWKEQCFGLTAMDVAEKVVNQVQAIGGTYGGNNKPTRFLCLILKLLQIQPDDDIIDELIANEDFKYVRALGAFYLRLTGRPADIYEKLEPLLVDYRKLRRRNQNDWSIVRIDEFIDSLLRDERVCGVALPRLANRDVLLQGGYLERPRGSLMHAVIWPESSNEFELPDDLDSLKACVDRIENVLEQMARTGNVYAQQALDKRRDGKRNWQNQQSEEEEKKVTKNIKDHRLFKKATTTKSEEHITQNKNNAATGSDTVEHSDDYWNEQRKLLGMKPLH